MNLKKLQNLRYTPSMSGQGANAYYDSTRDGLGLYSFVKSLFSQRNLLSYLVSVDLSAHYRRSLFGLLWTLINPIVSSIVLWVVFVSIFKARLINGTQFAPFLLAGVLTITFFNQGLMQAADSIANGTKIFLKIRVDPRLFCVSNVLSNAVNFFFGVIALILVSWISGAKISIWFPLVFLVGIALSVFTTGFGLIFAILFIRFNDVKYIMTILLQLLTYLTPVFYPKELMNPQVRLMLSLNPLTSFLDVFRHVVNGTEVATNFDWFYMFGSSTLVFVIGILMFQYAWPKTVVML